MARFRCLPAAATVACRRKFSIPVSLKTVERDWAQLGFHCGCMIDPPGHEWNNFTHDANELVAVVEGRMLFTLLDDSFELDPGGVPLNRPYPVAALPHAHTPAAGLPCTADDIFIPAGVPHSTKKHRRHCQHLGLRAPVPAVHAACPSRACCCYCPPSVRLGSSKHAANSRAPLLLQGYDGAANSWF